MIFAGWLTFCLFRRFAIMTIALYAKTGFRTTRIWFLALFGVLTFLAKVKRMFRNTG